MDGDEFEGDESEAYLRDHYVGDVEANCMEEDMDHDIPYNRSYAGTRRTKARMKK
jgi:hypothetical protein